MTTSNYITFILLGVIGLVFLIDFILNSRKKPLEKSVEKFVEEEKDKKKSWFNLKSFFWAYPIIFFLSQVFFFLTEDNHIHKLKGWLTDGLDPFYDNWGLIFLPLIIFHLLWFIISRYGNWILKRKKNISMSLLIISFVKLLLNYFIYTSQVRKYPYGNTYERKDADFSFHLSNLYSLEIDLFIPVTIVFLVVVWFFNDKIKAK